VAIHRSSQLKPPPKNGAAALVCVEPFPLDFLTKGFPDLRSLVEQKVEDVGLNFYRTSNLATFC
jgi:hypothetical protein